MNVHIVCRDLDEDKILPRLARTLAAGTGWTLSAQPDKFADLNYFIVYIDYAERLTDWHTTPIAAYFSHYEPDQPYKRLWWHSADQGIDIRTVTSDIAAEYLEAGKPIVKVTPPIDPMFEPDERKANRKPRIGFSGFVDRHSNRKGADLVARLMHDLSDRYEFIASGAGWPCKTNLYRFAELPKFYQSLDAFVCTSSIEGIPMPPLDRIAAILTRLRAMPQRSAVSQATS